jgi:hypothetical protein
MTGDRKLSREEKSLILTLLRAKPEGAQFIGSLDDIEAKEMKDGGMGSLLLVPKASERLSRSFGRQLVSAEFLDADGIPVSVALNLDTRGTLYELDVWKVNFAPLLAWPDPAKLKFIS